MKSTINTLAIIGQITLGVFFAVSGFIKGLDPYGTSLKIKEYLEVLGLGIFNIWCTHFSILLCFLELFLGFMLLLFIYSKAMILIAVCLNGCFTLVMLYFSFYPDYSIQECGCFGDFLPMTTNESLIKNIALLGTSIYLWYNTQKYSVRIIQNKQILIALFLFATCMCMPLYSAQKMSLYNFTGYNKNDNLYRDNNIHLFSQNYKEVTDSLLNNNSQMHLILILKQIPVKDELNIISKLQSFALMKGISYWAITKEECSILPHEIPIYYCDAMTLKSIFRSDSNGIILLDGNKIKNRWRLSSTTIDDIECEF